jgi:hypothetical protein
LPQRQNVGHREARLDSVAMTVAAFPGHATCCLRSCWPLPRWRSVARTGGMVTR